jgi:glycosyltransferase involved in cell wall biosynthesis
MPGCVLLIAYHFPPVAGSSGLQRTLAFCRHLRECGWSPVVLSVNPAAFERTSASQLADIPADVPVIRTLALDAARHLAIHGRYWRRLGIPDRWSSWRMTAVPCGLQLIRKHRVDVVWSTYPIATAHRIGASLARLSGRPWVADFRDPMVEKLSGTDEMFPSDPLLRRARLAIERKAADSAAKLIFCTAAAKGIVAERYPWISESRMAVISNGYDEEAFQDADTILPSMTHSPRKVLLHSGVIYPTRDRDPSALFKALRVLADEGVLSPANFELRLRDPSSEQYFRDLSVLHGIERLVTIAPSLAYRDALSEMMRSDGLLVLQGITSNPAVPAKLYEYLRAGRPIIALVHPDGETARLLREVGIDSSAPLTEPILIANLLRKWLSDVSESGKEGLPKADITCYSRRQLTRRLAEQLDQLTS